MNTLRDATWLKDEAFLLADVYDAKGEPMKVAPRNILKAALPDI